MIVQTRAARGQFFLARSHLGPALATLGACTYIASFALPFEFSWDIRLIALAVLSGVATLFNFRISPASSSPLVFPMLAFLFSTAASILLSQNFDLSLRLSASLIPAVLIFFLVAEHFDGIRHTRLLYTTFSAVNLGIATVLLWAAWTNGGVDPDAPRRWVAYVGSPILVERNDITFLAVTAPLSLVLLWRESRSAVGILAALSLLLSLAVVAIFQSRVALVTMVTSITCAVTILRPRLALACGLGSVILALLVDAACGFPLAAKFVQHWEGNGRIPLWLAAWAMFLDAPIWGHGPHTFVLSYTSYLQHLTLPAWITTDSIVKPWAHNLYLEVLAEQGIVGLAALGYLLISGLTQGWKLRYKVSNDARVYGGAALCGLIGLCVAGTVELSFLRHWVVIMLFVFLGIIAQLGQSNEN